MKGSEFEAEVMLTPAQAAAILGVDPKTVTRWATAGEIEYTRTVGNHRRYKEIDVYALRDRKSGVNTEGGQ